MSVAEHAYLERSIAAQFRSQEAFATDDFIGKMSRDYPVSITLGAATDVMPVWSPDGLRIAFLSDRGGQRAIYVTSGIGGGAFKLTNAEFPSSVGVWLKMDWTK